MTGTDTTAHLPGSSLMKTKSLIKFAPEEGSFLAPEFFAFLRSKRKLFVGDEPTNLKMSLRN